MVEEFIQTVCDVLDIDVPKISYDTSNFSTKSTLGQCDPSGKTIYLAHPTKITVDFYLVIAHELRHVWQMKNNYDFYLKDYKPRNQIDIASYNRQLAEIDANAFAEIMLVNCFNVKPLWYGLDKQTIEMIKQHIPNIVEQLNAE